LTKGPAAQSKWTQSVFILTYDEHGGLFDHVPPLPVTYRNPNGVSFDSTGPRTPTIVGGPFAPKRGVSTKYVDRGGLDNTSILQLMAERFGEPGEIYSHEVLGRTQQGIASVSAVLDATAKNTAVCSIGVGDPVAQVTAVVNSDLRRAFEGSLKTLSAQHPTELYAKYPELRINGK